ncbi:NfeD family protein [Methyloterricola oryzae]|uniref:NfeD family protein n=1 Tax=Methyloterricola oryzae TaxID=1495050 RepID=UPI0005EBBDC5|nr:NfeD family protein [Methyloterricola oryzae]
MWLVQIVFWHWWAFAALLLIVELLAPGMFFLWMAEAAFVTGALLWLMPAMSLEGQLIAFSVLAVVSIVLARRFYKTNPIKSEQPLLNQRTAQFVGRVFVLEHPIVNNFGKIRVDDSLWKIQGDDCPEGSRVKIVGVEGLVLKVEKIVPPAT